MRELTAQEMDHVAGGCTSCSTGTQETQPNINPSVSYNSSTQILNINYNISGGTSTGTNVGMNYNLGSNAVQNVYFNTYVSGVGTFGASYSNGSVTGTYSYGWSSGSVNASISSASGGSIGIGATIRW